MSASNTSTRQQDQLLANAAMTKAAEGLLSDPGFLGLGDLSVSALASLFSATPTSTLTATTVSTNTASTTALAGSSTVSSASNMVKTGSTTAPSWIATLSDSVLKADMNAMAGTVTEAGLAKLVTDLSAELTTNKTTLSANQFNDLKTIVTNLNVGESASSYHLYTLNALVNGNAANASWTGGAAASSSLGNLAVGSSAAQLSNLNGKWLQGTDLPSSTVTVSGTTSKMTYSASTAALFGSNGPSASDINQGKLGDCYFLSSIAEVASQNAGIIKNMITVNGNGSYGVAFHYKGATEYVTVNNTLQTGCNSGSNMWATLLEKAYAQLQSINVTTGNSYTGNSFTAIGNGGLPEYALEAITGASQITDFCANGTSWLCRTYNSSLSGTGSQSGISTATVLSTLKADLAAGDDLVLSSYTWSYDAGGKVQLVAGHAMSIYGIDAANGYLQIRNPWGSQTGQYWNTTFEVSLASLLAAGDTITVDNAGGTVPITPAAPILSNQTANQTLAANHAFSVSLANAFTDPQSQALTYKVTQSNGQALPSWMTFNAQTNTLSGTTPVSSSSTQLLVTVTDTAGLSASETFSITDTALAPILAKATAGQLVTPGRSFSFALPAGTFTDPQGETLSYSAKLASGAALPSWLSFNAQTQTFSGTAPTANTTLALQVTATNQAGLSVAESFTLNDAYVAPVLQAQTANQTLAANHAFSLSLASVFNDPQGLALSYKVTQANGQALPSWMTFNAATNTLSGTTPVSSSSTPILVKVTDTAGLSATESFTISDTAYAPTLSKATTTQLVTPGHSFSFALPAGTFTDPQGETLAYTAKLASGAALPSWLSFNAQTQTFSGMAPTANTTLSLLVSASNQAGLSTSETFTLNDSYVAPTLNLQTATQTINAGKAFSISLPSNTFVDPQGLALTYKAALSNGQALPSWLAFNAQTETFSGTAPTTAGSFVVKLTATDSAGLSTSETFTINDVATALKAPLVNPLPLAISFNANGTLNISVPQGTFTDPQGQTLSYSASQANGQALPSWITFNPKTDSFVATMGSQTESATITVKATDTSGLSASETFSLSIGGVAASPHPLLSADAPAISLVGVNMNDATLAHAA
ncbi:putative Ig domain-containing protein [Aquitalea aquatica]|uniref:Ig domain-containing protein n=1 Tax=Aquitalea aquatica TaxID=3044273 RepID=A0A838YDX5_9NEIS|nr:putative Ig domain-containing protein [Aquitalea magnusonii]MBA4710719.1 putative Ig domain-containing protein [Aquitalea magnusonii]